MMHIVKVVPLTAGLGKETLTYFTAQSVREGALVTISLRKKIVLALVVGLEDAATVKSDLKDAAFPLKKITSVKADSFFLPAFLEAVTALSREYAHTEGTIIAALTPRAILDAYEKGTVKTPAQKETRKVSDISPEPPYLLQASDEERIAHYKSLIRETFAKNRSVFLCLPTVRDIERVLPSLERGIGAYVHVLHSDLTKKKTISVWEHALKETHPVLIAATPVFLSLPRNDIATILLEHENTSAYMRQKRPYLDMRVVAERVARARRAKLVIGDVLLRTETLYRNENGETLEFSPLAFRALSPARMVFVDMTAYPHDRKKSSFTIVSEELLSLAKETYAQSERMFVLTGRKGVHPQTVCSDCGNTVTCPRCSVPLVLHTTRQKKNVYMCNKCSSIYNVPDACAVCGSWRLATLGIGSELVEKELKKQYPDKTILRLDKESAPTDKKRESLLHAFYTAPSAILVGTEMAVPYLPPMAHVAVASIDALFALPDFRIHERLFTLLLRARAKAQKTFLLQTRLPHVSVFAHVAQGNLLAFYREEISARKNLKYPPFSVFVKITWHGTDERVRHDAEKIQHYFRDYNTHTFPAFIRKIKGKYTHHALIRIPKESWPDERLLVKLKALPYSFEIEINPESIL